MTEPPERVDAGRQARSLDDRVVPFQIEGLPVRGRVVRLGASVDRVLSAHAYPPPVLSLLGEALALTAMLGSALKFDGIFTLQAQGSGPLSMLVVDYESSGNVRGYASFDEDALGAVDASNLGALFGEGSLALTIDPRLGRDRYQGIVPLEGTSLSICAQLYFDQSEQIPTRVKLAVAQQYQPGEERQRWRAGGLMIQHMPQVGGSAAPVPADVASDAWTRASLLADTIAPDELVDPTLGVDDLLWRLFNEDGVRVFEPRAVRFGCRCSRERLERVLATYPRAELESLAEAGAIVARCEFCNTRYSFPLDPT